MKNNILLVALLGGLLVQLPQPALLQGQEKGKGALEDFAEDHDDEESDCSDCGEDASEFFLYLFMDNIADVLRLWGRTDGTRSGAYPAFPYSEGEGFATQTSDYRSYFFNTEINYHYLNDNLRSYMIKWETQFVHRSKLSFDLAVYEEDLLDAELGRRKDHLTFFGVRYGYALYQTPQMLLNLEGGFRGFQRKRAHGGPEVALDLQLFPQKPLIIEMEVAAAYVSNGPLYTVESSAGVAVGRFEVLGGMRILRNRDADLLDGFRVGLRVWY